MLLGTCLVIYNDNLVDKLGLANILVPGAQRTSCHKSTVETIFPTWQLKTSVQVMCWWWALIFNKWGISVGNEIQCVKATSLIEWIWRGWFERAEYDDRNIAWLVNELLSSYRTQRGHICFAFIQECNDLLHMGCCFVFFTYFSYILEQQAQVCHLGEKIFWQVRNVCKIFHHA